MLTYLCRHFTGCIFNLITILRDDTPAPPPPPCIVQIRTLQPHWFQLVASMASQRCWGQGRTHAQGSPPFLEGSQVTWDVKGELSWLWGSPSWDKETTVLVDWAWSIGLGNTVSVVSQWPFRLKPFGSGAKDRRRKSPDGWVCTVLAVTSWDSSPALPLALGC